MSCDRSDIENPTVERALDLDLLVTWSCCGRTATIGNLATMLPEYAVHLHGMLPPVAEGHRDGCQSWLPLEPPCLCEGSRTVIVANTFAEARDHLHRLGYPITNALVLRDRATAERVRGLHWPLPRGWHFEILEWPHDPRDHDAVYHALKAAGWPPEELAA